MQNDLQSLQKYLLPLKIDTLNPMQLATLEASTQGKDIILLSATGTGKTVGFLLPVIQTLDASIPGTQALIVVPSRELALQIEQVFKKMGTGFKVTCCYGGHLRETEENNLLQAPALIIGTPGRLGDHIRRGNIQLNGIETLVLDEYDKSLELGFQEELSFITGSLKALRRKILTSATVAETLPEFIGVHDPVVLNYLTGEPDASVSIQIVHSDNVDKLDTLFKLICWIGSRSAIIFCNHRESVERTSAFLSDKGLVTVFYHGALEQPERDSALCKFRNGTSDILVTTDLASRGLDIPNIRYIIHYHLPLTEEIFTHRNGRTARMDASGTVIVILSPDEKPPAFLPPDTGTITLSDVSILPDKPKWSTLFVAAGKKDKVNKVDIVGFLTQKGELKKEDIGLIEVKDFFSFVGIRKSKVGTVLQLIKNEKIKNKKVRIDVAR